MATRNDTGSSDLAQFGYKQELNRTLSTTDLIVYGLVFMVPIAPWAIFGVVYNASGGMVPLVYLIGLVAMIFTALSYAGRLRITLAADPDTCPDLSALRRMLDEEVRVLTAADRCLRTP